MTKKSRSYKFRKIQAWIPVPSLDNNLAHLNLCFFMSKIKITRPTSKTSCEDKWNAAWIWEVALLSGHCSLLSIPKLNTRETSLSLGIKIKADICKIAEQFWIIYSPAELVSVCLNLLTFKERMWGSKGGIEKLRSIPHISICTFSQSSPSLIYEGIPNMEGWRDFLPRSVRFLFSLSPLFADVGVRVSKTNAFRPWVPLASLVLITCNLCCLLGIPSMSASSISAQWVLGGWVCQSLWLLLFWQIHKLVFALCIFVLWTLSIWPCPGMNLLFVLTRLASPQIGENSARQQIAPSEGPFGAELTASFGETTQHHLMATLNLFTFPS